MWQVLIEPPRDTKHKKLIDICKYKFQQLDLYVGIKCKSEM